MGGKEIFIKTSREIADYNQEKISRLMTELVKRKSDFLFISIVVQIIETIFVIGYALK